LLDIGTPLVFVV